MFLYSKTTFFQENLDRNAFIDYYYTRMKNKITLIPYLLGFNALAVVFTLFWMAVMFPYYFFRAVKGGIKEASRLIINENKRVYKAAFSTSPERPNEQKQTENKIPGWLN